MITDPTRNYNPRHESAQIPPAAIRDCILAPILIQ